jgi:hypothetical protein
MFPHTPALHRPLQHSPGDMQERPSSPHTATQAPASQNPVQHSLPDEQGPPSSRHPPAVDPAAPPVPAVGPAPAPPLAVPPSSGMTSMKRPPHDATIKMQNARARRRRKKNPSEAMMRG